MTITQACVSWAADLGLEQTIQGLKDMMGTLQCSTSNANFLVASMITGSGGATSTAGTWLNAVEIVRNVRKQASQLEQQNKSYNKNEALKIKNKSRLVQHSWLGITRRWRFSTPRLPNCRGKHCRASSRGLQKTWGSALSKSCGMRSLRMCTSSRARSLLLLTLLASLCSSRTIVEK